MGKQAPRRNTAFARRATSPLPLLFITMTAPSALPSSALYTSIAVFLLGAIALVVSSGYSVGAVLLLLGGIYCCIRLRHYQLQRYDYLIIFAVVFYGSVGIFDAIIHQFGSSSYDKPIRFLLAPLCLALIIKRPPTLCWLWTGLSVGCILTALWSGYQKFYLLTDRAGGYTHLIQYGNIAMLMGVWCLAGLGWAREQPRHRWWFILLSAGALCGMAASLMSGSRGGWVGFPIVLFVLYRTYSDRVSIRQKLAIAVLTILAVVAVMYIPNLHVKERLQAAVSDVQLYKNEGYTNTSVGARFAMWDAALQLFAQKPLLGWGGQNMLSGMSQLADEGKADPIVKGFSHAHNEVLTEMAKRGLLGLFSLLCLYIIPIMLFRKGLRHPSLTQRSIAAAGLLLPVTYVDFGLSQAFFSHNSGLMIYSFWLMIWWGLYRPTLIAHSGQNI